MKTTISMLLMLLAAPLARAGDDDLDRGAFLASFLGDWRGNGSYSELLPIGFFTHGSFDIQTSVAPTSDAGSGDLQGVLWRLSSHTRTDQGQTADSDTYFSRRGDDLYVGTDEHYLERAGAARREKPRIGSTT